MHSSAIRAVSSRMSHLIDDLLKLSVVARHALCRQDIDLSALATEVADTLRGELIERRTMPEFEKWLADVRKNRYVEIVAPELQ